MVPYFLLSSNLVAWYSSKSIRRRHFSLLFCSGKNTYRFYNRYHAFYISTSVRTFLFPPRNLRLTEGRHGRRPVSFRISLCANPFNISVDIIAIRTRKSDRTAARRTLASGVFTPTHCVVIYVSYLFVGLCGKSPLLPSCFRNVLNNSSARLYGCLRIYAHDLD
jgi:hypothetical protein